MNHHFENVKLISVKRLKSNLLFQVKVNSFTLRCACISHSFSIHMTNQKMSKMYNKSTPNITILPNNILEVESNCLKLWVKYINEFFFNEICERFFFCIRVCVLKHKNSKWIKFQLKFFWNYIMSKELKLNFLLIIFLKIHLFADCVLYLEFF